MLTDLTRTNDAERALAYSETKYRALVEQVPAVIYIDTFEERPVTLFVSPYTERLSGTGRRSGSMIPNCGCAWCTLTIGTSSREEWPGHLDEEDRSTWEYRVFHKDGHVVWVKDVARLIRSEDGTRSSGKG